MATPSENAVDGVMMANPFSGDHSGSSGSSCLDDPNFATICSFIQKFGEIVRIGHVPFDELQKWLENTTEIPVQLIQLHLTLLRRVFKTVSMDKWERSLMKFGHMYCSQDAWELERFGYKKAKMQTKLSILKNLLEAQFDFNVKFKSEVNKLQAADLRLTPLGRDTEGQVYWYQVDEDANLRVYREDIDDETWEIVASTKAELVELISQLQRGEVRKPEPEEGIILPEEDSNSKDAIEQKEIILDTGKVEVDESSSEDSNTSGESKEEVKKVEPLLLRNVFSANKLQSSQLTIIDNTKVKEEATPESPGESKTVPGIKLMFGVKTKVEPENVSTEDPPKEHKSEQQSSISKLDEIVQSLASTAENVSVEIVKKNEINEPSLERTLKEIKEKVVDSTKEEKLASSDECSLSRPSENVAIDSAISAEQNLPVPPIQDEKPLTLKNSDIDMDTDSKSVEGCVVADTVNVVQETPTLKANKSENIIKDIETQSISETSVAIKPEPVELDASTVVKDCEEPKPEAIIQSDNDPTPTEMISTTETTMASQQTEQPSKVEEDSNKSPSVNVAQISTEVTIDCVPSSGTKEQEKPLPTTATIPLVPEETISSSKPDIDPLPTLETPVEKGRAYVCGDEKSVVVEDPITKEHAWVCGEEKSENELSKVETLQKTNTDTMNLQKDIARDSLNKIDEKEHSIDEESQPNNIKEKVEDVVMPTSDKIPQQLGEQECKSDNDSSVTKTEVNSEIVASPSAKINSSLVSALYSESSESGDDSMKPISETNKSEESITITDQHVTSSNADISEKVTDKMDSDNSEIIIPQKMQVSTEAERTVAIKEQEAETKQCSTDTNSTLNVIVDPPPSDLSKDELGSENANSKAEEEKSTIIKESKDDLKEKYESETKNDLTQVKSTDDTTTGLTAAVSQSLSSSNEIINNGAKRKAEDDVESSAKLPRLDETMTETKSDKPKVDNAPFNPIVGETIEEEVMTIVGEGSGAPNEGSNENSPVPIAASEVPGSQDESIESEEEDSRSAFPSRRGRGGRRGRGRRGRPPGIPRNTTPKQSSQPKPRGGGSRGLREVARLGVSLDSIEVNGDNDTPVRSSRRIAQIRQKEEEERRQMEEERLAQLKAAQIKKQAKQAEREHLKKDSLPPGVKGKKGSGKKSFKGQIQQHGIEYVPEESASESEERSDEDGSDDEFAGKNGKKKRRRRKNGKGLILKRGGRPWATSSDEDDEEAVEEEEEYHYEEEEEELVFKSDHEFSPESDLGEDDDAGPSRHARTAKQDKGDLFEEGNCCKCGKGDHPEWILLCDKCDKGWHASCLRPQLWVVPEGEWFCPPCQHNMLIENLSKNLVVYEDLLQKRETEILRKQRLAFVEISLSNVLPDKEQENEEKVEENEKHSHQRKKPRRRILSDEELSDEFINDRSGGDDLSNPSRTNSSDEYSDEPTYRLRARRTKKAFNFKEYDDMINSALRVDDDEEVGEVEPEEEEENAEEDGEEKLNGENEDAHVGGGKNDAYLKHLERQQAGEDDETDEELLDEKERLRRKELKKHGGQRKSKRRINDLDDYSEEENSDDDFKASEEEDDDEEEVGNDGESEWSGDKMEDDSDDSIARKARRKDRHGRLGRREKYSDKGLVRRSTRKRKSRISYDESDEDEEEDDHADKWQSDEEEEMTEESETNSESDDDTWGKKKKKAIPKSSFFSREPAAAPSTKGKGKGGVKRKKRKTEDDDVDRAWNSARGKKQKDEPVERRTRGRKINFKDILDSGESDDEGNVRPKRRPLSDSDDSRSPSSSRKLAEEIRAENARKEKEYEESLAKSREETTPKNEIDKEVEKKAPIMPESMAIAKLSESSVNSANGVPLPYKLPVPPAGSQQNSVPPNSSPPVGSPPIVQSPLPPSSSPVNSIPPVHSPMMGSPIGMPLTAIPPKSSPAHIPPPPLLVSSPSNIPPQGAVPLPPSVAHLFGKSLPPPPPVILSNPHQPGLPFPLTTAALGLPHGPSPGRAPAGPPIVPPIVPVTTPEKKSKSKGSRGSRGSKGKQSPTPMEMDQPLPKPIKTSTPPPVPALTKSSKKKDKDLVSPSSINVPNPALLMAGGGVSLPDMLSQGIGIPPPNRTPPGTHPPNSGTGGSSSKKSSKSSRSSSNPSQQTTPPPVSQNLSPSLPVEIDRVPNPALFPGNPGMRPFHPMWARNPGPPPPGYGNPGNPPMPPNLGKPSINSPHFGPQGPPPRSGFSSPPPLRIPNPNSSPLQAFQHFKRDSPLGNPLYRLAAGQPPQVLANILPPGMMPPHPAGAERFFGAPSGYPNPYGLLPHHAQGQPPQAFLPYDYRPPEAPFKDEPPPPTRTSSSSLPTPVTSGSSSPPPPSSGVVSLAAKDEGPATSEFGGLVSYFSSQRSEEDMDT